MSHLVPTTPTHNKDSHSLHEVLHGIEEAQHRIEQAKRQKSFSLDLSGLNLTTVPEGLKQLPTLQRLILSNNQFTVLSTLLSQLTSLRALYVHNNQLTVLPEWVGQLAGRGRISAAGVDVIEGSAKPPISITLDQSHHVSIQNSSNVQVGNSNVQEISNHIGKIITAIDHSNATESEKAEAKSLLKKFLEHPLVTSIAGGVASSMLTPK